MQVSVVVIVAGALPPKGEDSSAFIVNCNLVSDTTQDPRDRGADVPQGRLEAGEMQVVPYHAPGGVQPDRKPGRFMVLYPQESDTYFSLASVHVYPRGALRRRSGPRPPRGMLAPPACLPACPPAVARAPALITGLPACM